MTKAPITKTLDFLFDFASPNAYFAYKVLPPILERTGADLKMTPVLLGGIFKATGNQPPMVQAANVPAKLKYGMLEIDRFVKKHHLTNYQFNPHFPVNTLAMMRASIVADADGKLAPFLEAGFKAMWEDGLNMADADVMAGALNAAGFDAAEMLTRTQDPDVKAKLMANTEDAVARGVFGIPTFFVGDEMYFGKDRLGEIEEALGA
ncbi:MAG: 2-hydroxychromene-2-carboxylate isomerase [Pseudomonadota bacterium]